MLHPCFSQRCPEEEGSLLTLNSLTISSKYNCWLRSIRVSHWWCVCVTVTWEGCKGSRCHLTSCRRVVTSKEGHWQLSKQMPLCVCVHVCALPHVCDGNNKHMTTCPGIPQNMVGHWVLVLEKGTEFKSAVSSCPSNVNTWWIFLPSGCIFRYLNFVIGCSIHLFWSDFLLLLLRTEL